MIRRIENKSVRPLAAAQVIADLASAVKELIDNSIDADATQITVTFGNYALDSIEVQDNGCGIPVEEMSSVGKRSHTSKITSDENLHTVQTLGFRGEALHSLAALSTELIITSKWQDENESFGTRITLSKELDEAKLERVTFNQGTSVQIVGFLAGLPVRLAEWKRNTKRHFSRAIYFLQSYVLAVPKIKLRCVHDKQVLFSSSGSGDISKAFAEAFGGSELKFKLRSFSVAIPGVECEIYYAPSQRKGPDRQFLFINQRPIELPTLFKKLNETTRLNGWEGYATIIVHMISTVGIDFNLTPDKRQVILPFETDLVTQMVSQFSQQLSNSVQVPRSLPGDSIKTSSQSIIISSSLSACDGEESQQSKGSSQPSMSYSPQSSAIEMLPDLNSLIDVPVDGRDGHPHCMIEKSDFARMEIIGQYNCGFILAKIQGADGNLRIFIIDQHASDERFRLETLEKSLSFTIQSLVHPMSLATLGVEDVMLMEGNLDRLRRYGFIISKISLPPADGSYEIVALSRVGSIQLDFTDFIELLGLLKNEEFRGLHSLSKVKEALGYKACRSAIMIGDPLNMQQMTQIVRNLASLATPWICAHGRPTVRLLYTNEIVSTSNDLL